MSRIDIERPNILWVSFEDTNPFYGCYGDTYAVTPNLDRLASEGCIWPNAVSTAPVCSPARSAVITGMYPVSIGTHHHRTGDSHYPELGFCYEAVPPPYVKCFTEYFRAAGYYCTNNSKTDYQFHPPVTAWDECSNDAHWRNRPDPDQPFFAVFNPCCTHESGMWEDKDIDPVFDPDGIELPPYFPDTPKVRASMARMYTNIKRADEYLGELLQQLEEDGLADDTIVVHWSDHGPMPRGKRWLYESGIRIPMIVRWPGMIEPGSINDRVVSTVDLGPTMLSVAGLTIPNHLQGRAFVGPKGAPPREFAFAARDRYDEMYDMARCVRSKRFKYIRNFQPENPYLLYNCYRNIHPIMQEMWRCHVEGSLEGPQAQMFRTERPAEELFDLAHDPHELCNLAEDPEYADELIRHRAALDDWRREVRDLGDVPEDVMWRQMWPDGTQPVTKPPQLIPLGPHAFGTRNEAQSGTIEGPAILQMQSATQGASIAYRLDEEEGWRLYSRPVVLERGTTKVTAKAVRIGYADSEEVSAEFNLA